MMDKWPHLSSAPITEAVIEFQFSDSESLTIEVLRNISHLLESMYPIEQEKKSQVIRAVVKGSTPETEYIDEGTIGFTRRSEDGIKIIQLLQDRFAYSHLAPYTTWDDLEQGAFEAWNIFRKEVGIKHIKRVGVRFLNRLDIDLPIKDFADYLYSPPVISDKLPQAVMMHAQRVVLPNKDIEAIAIINQSVEGVDHDKKIVPVILDIDVGKIGNFEASEENILQILRSLQGYKNDIFFGYITPKALEKYI